MSSLVEIVREEIMDAVEKDQLTLPTLPEVALKVRETAEDPDAVIADLTTIISHDAALAARIIRVTNSPLLRAPQEVKDLNMAISRLGMNYTANLAIGLAMEQMFQATSEVIDKKMRSTWTTTTRVAALSYVLTTEAKAIPPDEATLAALVHRLGVLPVLTFAEERDDLIRDGISLEKVIEAISPELGRLILRKWEFPDALADVPVAFLNFSEAANEIGYKEVVRIASLLYFREDAAHPIGKVDWTQVPALALFNLEPDKNGERVQEVLAQAAEVKDLFA